jgi:uncharacterized protein YbjT (DUF2867 family)
MKALITGTAGLLGGHLLRKLQQRGDPLRALVLSVEDTQKLIEYGVEVRRGGVTDTSTFGGAIGL